MRQENILKALEAKGICSISVAEVEPTLQELNERFERFVSEYEKLHKQWRSEDEAKEE